MIWLLHNWEEKCCYSWHTGLIQSHSNSSIHIYVKLFGLHWFLFAFSHSVVNLFSHLSIWVNYSEKCGISWKKINAFGINSILYVNLTPNYPCRASSESHDCKQFSFWPLDGWVYMFWNIAELLESMLYTWGINKINRLKQK
jgi:hypothetical protein